MISHRAASFQESVIREMTRLHHQYGGVNLAQGFPDFDPPAEIIDAACRAMREGYNQYAVTWGTPRLREAVSRHATEFNRIPTDPVENVTVCCGATETMIATLMAVCNPGDEVIIFTPFYENYGPDTVLSGAQPVYVPLRPTQGSGFSGQGSVPPQPPEDRGERLGAELDIAGRASVSSQAPLPMGEGCPEGGVGSPKASDHESHNSPRSSGGWGGLLPPAAANCLQPPAWSFDPEELAAAFSPRTRAIIVNTPHNPTGHVFTRAELESIAALCIKHDCLSITDEIYEHILYDGREHVSLASLDGMRERTITISGASKTFAVTGWRLGWAIAPKELTVGIRRVHDFLTVGAPHPLQEAAAVALQLPPAYYAGMVDAYTRRRDRALQMIRDAGLQPYPPEGAYYTLARFDEFPYEDDVAFAMHLVREVGIAVVPGSSFYPAGAAEGKRLIRFAFPKREATLEDAAQRLQTLAAERRA